MTKLQQTPLQEQQAQSTTHWKIKQSSVYAQGHFLIIKNKSNTHTYKSELIVKNN